MGVGPAHISVHGGGGGVRCTSQAGVEGSKPESEGPGGLVATTAAQTPAPFLDSAAQAGRHADRQESGLELRNGSTSVIQRFL